METNMQISDKDKNRDDGGITCGTRGKDYGGRH